MAITVKQPFLPILALLICQLLVLIIQPLLLSGNSFTLLYGLVAGFLLTGVMLTSLQQTHRIFKWFIMLTVLLSGVLYYISPDVQLYKTTYIVAIIMLLVVGTVMQIGAILKSSRVDKTVLIICINCYITSAYAGAALSWLIETLIPGSFSISHPVAIHQLHDFVYFSFVTMATLGYGDVTPVNEFAKVAAIFISLFGQLYVAIFIAVVLGKYLQHQQQVSSANEQN